MALRHHGLVGYRTALEKDLVLAEYLISLLRGRDDFKIFEPHSLSIVCFRYRQRQEGLLMRKHWIWQTKIFCNGFNWEARLSFPVP